MSIYNDNSCKPIDECNKPVDSYCDPCNKPTAPNLCNDLKIKSQNNTIAIVKNGCNVDLSIDPLSINKAFKINSGTCISIVKELIDGVVHYTPVLDMSCIAAIVCRICTPPAPINNCTIPNNVVVISS